MATTITKNKPRTVHRVANNATPLRWTELTFTLNSGVGQIVTVRNPAVAGGAVIYVQFDATDAGTLTLASDHYITLDPKDAMTFGPGPGSARMAVDSTLFIASDTASAKCEIIVEG